ncbi:11589_t:CDS:1, partial [Scutellospora calospora]
STSSVKDTEPETFQTDEILENSSSNIEDLNSENLVIEKENTEASLVRTLDNSNKENITTESIQAETAMEIEDSNLPRTPIVLITNNNKSYLQTKNLKERFTTVSSKKRKNKKDISKQKEELTRVALYRKICNG